jgi:hypothetical protein
MLPAVPIHACCAVLWSVQMAAQETEQEQTRNFTEAMTVRKRWGKGLSHSHT